MAFAQWRFYLTLRFCFPADEPSKPSSKFRSNGLGVPVKAPAPTSCLRTPKIRNSPYKGHIGIIVFCGGWFLRDKNTTASHGAVPAAMADMHEDLPINKDLHSIIHFQEELVVSCPRSCPETSKKGAGNCSDLPTGHQICMRPRPACCMVRNPVHRPASQSCPPGFGTRDVHDIKVSTIVLLLAPTTKEKPAV